MQALRLASLGVALSALLLVSFGTAAAAPEDVTVTAEQLAKDYALNPAGFDQKYVGRMLVVEGVVETPDAVDTISKEHWLMLRGYRKSGDPVPTLVRCKFIPDFKALKPGDPVKVRGKCLGHEKTLFAAQLVDCELLAKGK